MTIKWRQQYDGSEDAVRKATDITCKDDTLTVQSLNGRPFAETTDINLLMKRFGLEDTPLPPAPLDPSYYGDLSNIPDLRAIMDIQADAKNRFMALPAHMRAYFNNDPSNLWQWINDDRNHDRAVDMGLLKRPPEPPQPTTPATTPGTAGSASPSPSPAA